MVCTEQSSGTSVPKKEPQVRHKRKSRPQGLPSPALCCACGLCIMLAGINITLVGAFAFATLMPSGNPPIIIGPVLLLIAFMFFTACCVCSRMPPPHNSRRTKSGNAGFLRHHGAAFEIETSEHTIQDTTAVQLSPTNSPSLSHSSELDRDANINASTNGNTNANANPPAPDYSLFTMDANGPDSMSAAFSTTAGSGEEVRLTLPSDAT
ncbi:transmembrane protein 275 [Tachysurus fulvidraco]|uniref:transmembrane protein 275 n=1 Tax=Tachysurus fulvidraco TaxID=1234273 RepID=UPI001FF064C9|nr:transmembrane protein 275 [Tachysurus fulvidraco]